MKKSSILVLLVMLTVTILAACSPKAAETTTEVEEPAGGEETTEINDADLVFASVVKSIGDTWFKRYEQGVVKFGEDYGVTSFMEGPSTPDSAAQVAVIEDLIAQDVDVLINVPYGVPENEAAQKKAMDAGIIVIGHEAESATEGTLNYDLEAFDNCAYGEEVMKELATRMGEEGQYAQFVGSLTNATHNIWTECAKAYQEEHYPNMEFVGKYESKENAENGYNMMKDILKTYPDIKGIESSDSVEIQGIGRAIEEAGLQDSVAVVGTCIVSDVGALIQSGAIDLSMTWDPADTAYAASVVGYKILHGEEITEGMDLGVAGFESIHLATGQNGVPVIYGNAWIKITVDTMDQYNF